MHAALRQHGVPAHAVVPQISLTSRRRNELVLELSIKKQKQLCTLSKNVGNKETSSFRKEASACCQGRRAS